MPPWILSMMPRVCRVLNRFSSYFHKGNTGKSQLHPPETKSVLPPNFTAIVV